MTALDSSTSPTLSWHALDDTTEVAIDAQSGGLLGFRNGKGEAEFAHPSRVLVSVGGHEVSAWESVPGNNLVGARSTAVTGGTAFDTGSNPISIDVSEGRVTVTREERGLSISEEWHLAGDETLARNIRVEWGPGWAEGFIRDITLLGPAVPNSVDGVELKFLGMAAPSEWVKAWFNGSLTRHITSTGGVPALVPLMADVGNAALAVRSSGRVVLTCLADLYFAGLAEVVVDNVGGAPGHVLKAAARTDKPGSLHVGPQILSFSEDPADLGVTVRSFVRHPDDGTRWLRSLSLYEVHIGNKFPDPFVPNEKEGKNPYPTMDDLIADLPRIKDLGFSAIQLMPVFPFPGYTIYSYDTPASQYGGDSELSKLAIATQSAGLKLVVDLILHGPVDKQISAYAQWARSRSEYLELHPDWFMLDEAGEVRRTHTYSFDLANTEVQEHIAGAMVQLLRTGVSGFRVDAPLWNLFPNWREDLEYPAGHSTMGWVGLIQLARELAHREGLECALIGETAGVSGLAVFDAVYGYEEMGLFGGFVRDGMPFLAPELSPPRPSTGKSIRKWLQDKSSVNGLEAMSHTVRHIDSHDSYEWGGLSTVASRIFGDAFPAVLVTAALIPGPWMHFCGAEEGQEQLVSTVMKLRHHPAVAEGFLDFGASSSDLESLFHCVARSPEGIQLVLVNLSDVPLTGTVEVDPDVASLIAEASPIRDTIVLENNRCQISMEPWGYRVFQNSVSTRGGGTR